MNHRIISVKGLNVATAQIVRNRRGSKIIHNFVLCIIISVFFVQCLIYYNSVKF